MDKYDEITRARKTLNINESESLKNIKEKFKNLIKKYHPDVCKKDKESCKQKSIEIIKAYEIIMNYCNNYKFSFNKEEVNKYLSPKETWKERFGNDPIWSNSFDKEKDL